MFLTEDLKKVSEFLLIFSFVSTYMYSCSVHLFFPTLAPQKWILFLFLFYFNFEKTRIGDSSPQTFGFCIRVFRFCKQHPPDFILMWAFFHPSNNFLLSLWLYKKNNLSGSSSFWYSGFNLLTKRAYFRFGFWNICHIFLDFKIVRK